MNVVKPPRRTLTLPTLDAVVTEVERLRVIGYESAGQWNLAQVCGHLTEWVRFSLEGFPIRPMPWIVRATLGRFGKKYVLRYQRFPAGQWTIRETVPPADRDEWLAENELRNVIERFQNHVGDYHPSPLFGSLSREEWTQIHRIHSVHHLSFLVPKWSGTDHSDLS